MMTRRTFLAAGVAGAMALAAAQWLRRAPSTSAAASDPLATLDADAPAVVAAIVPVLLDGALPSEPRERASAIDETITNVGRAIAGLPLETQAELRQLFALLGFAPARIALAGVRSPWSQAPAEEIARFLDRWQSSRFMLLRSAYDALHQLVLAAWYGNARAWAALGYAGPPAVDAS
jgi:hypothetical protein